LELGLAQKPNCLPTLNGWHQSLPQTPQPSEFVSQWIYENVASKTSRNPESIDMPLAMARSRQSL